MRRAAVIVLAIVLAMLTSIVCFVISYRWDSATNRGFTVGYYGEFNTVSNALASLGGVTILNAFSNQDVTLEEFGFEISTPENKKMRLFVGESGPLRGLVR